MEREQPRVIEIWKSAFESIGQDGRRIVLETWRQLAKGQTAAPDRVARAAGVSRDSVISIFRAFGARTDADGNAVGFGIDLTPTPHRVRLETTDVPLYGWCGPDTLIFGLLLKKTISVESKEPITGATVRVTAGPDGIEQGGPDRVFVSLVPGIHVSPDVRRNVCHYQHFFGSRERAEAYARENGLIVLPVEAFYKDLRDLVERLWDLTEAEGARR